MVTDLDTRFLKVSLGDLENVEVMQQDIVKDPLPDDSFDLVHARLVFEHIPERDQGDPSGRPILAKGWMDVHRGC